jgi:CheY-like chemotaxis protein
MATVLVLDDDYALGRAVQRLLSTHDVTVVTGAPDALARLGLGQRFDVVPCDVNMPRMRGSDFRDPVYALGREQARRIVFMTGQAFDGGENRVIAKPFDAATLRKAVDGFLPITIVRR